MRAFIIRPFGKKEGIDFDAVEEKLIGPALDAQPEPPSGRTTGDIVKAGNIRTDMFEEILTADLVIADLSIHNANVFYELGIRHALRDKRTVLIRCDVEGHAVPFDLKTDRYLGYDKDELGKEKDVAALTKAIRETIASDDVDSPVFQLLPELVPVDPKDLIVVPRLFSEEVAHAAANRDRGRLRLLAEEVLGFKWEVAGLRSVGVAQFMLKDWEGGKASLEAVTKLFPFDVEANTLLGTVHQRLGDLTSSSLVLERVLESHELSPHQRAELRALQGRNSKTAWEEDWRGLQDLESRQLEALRSGHLAACGKAYEDAFLEDRNHFYSGLNALAMLLTTLGLARAHPGVWEGRFDGDDDDEAAAAAARALRLLERRADELAAAVKLSVASGIERRKRETSDDLIWAQVSEADLTFLTSSRPARVAQAYRDALAGAQDFVESAARKQLGLYAELGLFTENVEAALDAIPAHVEGSRRPPHVLVFTGHRVDAPGRETARFPPDKEGLARQWIEEAVRREKEQSGDAPLLGMSGGASGGDILFHEVCAAQGIGTQMYLTLPPREYIATSVADGGEGWVRRFRDLVDAGSPLVLSEEKDLPPWLRFKEDYDIWQRSNRWLLNSAFALGEHVSLIALWNGQPGDGAGGTQDMVERAREQGARVLILDASEFVE